MFNGEFHLNSVFQSRQVEEEDFPRGGASALSPLEVRKIKHEAERDILFGVITLNGLLSFFNVLYSAIYVLDLSN